MVTYSGEVYREAILPSEGALQEHFVDIMTSAVVEIRHVELLRLEVDKITLLLQQSEDFRLGQVRVSDLIVLIEQCQQLPDVVQIVLRDLRETKLVEVAEGDGRKGEVGRCHLIKFGDVRELEVVVHPVHAHKHQETQRAHEGQRPQKATERHVAIGENVAHAM